MIRKIVSLPKRILKRLILGASEPDPAPPTRPPPPPQPDPPKWMQQEHDHSHGHDHGHSHDHDHGHGGNHEQNEFDIEVTTEDTPNPNARKYVLYGAVISNSFSAKSEAEATGDLAKTLIGIEGVASIFGINDFVTVTKAEAVEWKALDDVIISAVKEHFTADK